MIGNKQRLPRKGMLLSHQKECLLWVVFDKDVSFKTRKTTSELCFVTYLRFHLVECTRVYVMCVGWEVFWNSKSCSLIMPYNGIFVPLNRRLCKSVFRQLSGKLRVFPAKYYNLIALQESRLFNL